MAVLPVNPSLLLMAPSLFLFRASFAVFALFDTLIKFGRRLHVRDVTLFRAARMACRCS